MNKLQYDERGESTAEDRSHPNFRNMRRRMLIAGAAALGLALSPRSLRAQDEGDDEPRFLRIASGPAGGVYFPVASLIANAISRPPGAPACAAAGPCGARNVIAIADASSGSVENVRLLRSGEVDAALLQADVAAWALAGERAFREDGPYGGLRTLAALHNETLHAVVRADSGLISIADLGGQRVAIGDDGSGTRAAALDALSAYGLEAGDIQPFSGGVSANAAALAGGEIDALFFFGGAPAPALEGLAATAPFRLLPVAGLAVTRRIDATVYYQRAIVPAETYAGVGETTTIGVSALLAVDAGMDDGFVAEILEALWRPGNRAILDGGHPAGRAVRKETATRGVSTPLHQAAAAVYANPPNE